jgi:EAL domain-containing protein (putative c-di-GMP-specific phosphodiesterase class I)
MRATVPLGAPNERLPPSVHKIGALLDVGRPSAPGFNRNAGRRIFRRAFDQLVAVRHVHQHIPFCVASSDDLHFLEENRSTLAEHNIALRELCLELDGAVLIAGKGNVGRLFGEAQNA